MWYAATLPALVKEPPMYTSPPLAAIVLTQLSVPALSADHALPSHLAMLLADTPPAPVQGTTDVHFVASGGDRFDPTFYSFAQRRPRAPVPFGDAFGWHAALAVEPATHVNIAATDRDIGGEVIKPCAQR